MKTTNKDLRVMMVGTSAAKVGAIIGVHGNTIYNWLDDENLKPIKREALIQAIQQAKTTR